MPTQTINPKSKSFHRNIWVLTITSFLTDISSEMLVNLLPLFLFNVLGVRTAIVGLIEGVAETTASLVKILSGIWSDRLGKRKPLVVCGYGLSTLAKPFLFFATSWIWVLGVRFMDRVGKGIRTSPRDALLAGSSDNQHHGLAFGLHRAGDTAGAFLGLGIATWIIWTSQSGDILLTRQTFQWVVLASVIPAVLAVIVLGFGAIEISYPNHQNTHPLLRFRSMDQRFRIFLIAMIIFTLGNSSDAFIILLAQDRGLSVLQIMGMLLTFTAVYTLLSGPAGWLSDHLGRRRIIIAGWIAYGLIYLGFSLSSSGNHIWILFGLYGIYYGFTEGAAKALVADLVPAEQRGTAYGLFHAAIGLSALPASLIAGILWQGIGKWSGFGPSAPFLFGTLMAFSAGVLFWFRVNPTSNHNPVLL
jgi:MFS family permease